MYTPLPQIGIVVNVFKDLRYTYVTLEDGRTIKGKWNHRPNYNYIGRTISWTTNNPQRWNPNEWYNDIHVLPEVKPQPRKKNLMKQEAILTGRSLRHERAGKGHGISGTSGLFSSIRRTFIVHPYDSSRAVKESIINNAISRGRSVRIKYVDDGWANPTIKHIEIL